MWGLITTVFLVFYCGISFYVGHRGWTTISKNIHRIYKSIYWVLFGILILSFPLTEFVKDYLSEAGRLWFTVWSWYSMLAVVYIFLLVLLIDLFRLVDKYLDFVPTRLKTHRRTPGVITSLIIILVTFILIYGTWNAQSPIVTNYEITVNKNGGSAGDIVEGIPKQEDAKKLVNEFKEMDPKYGKVAVPGNHDRWLRSEEGVKSFLEAGITLLRDEILKVEDSFFVVGRDDPGHGRRDRKGLEELMEGVDSLLPIILLDHQPIDLHNAQQNNVDIQLSGHTHMGQIFPANFITSKIYELDWGILTKESYNLIVTNGYGTWGPPLRIGNSPEIVHITLIFEG